MRDIIEKLIEKLRRMPEWLTLEQYRDVTGRCTASAYTDLRRKAGLGIRVDGRTYFLRDFMIDELEHPTNWIPQKDRISKPANITTPKKSTRPTRQREKRAVAARRKRDEVVA